MTISLWILSLSTYLFFWTETEHFLQITHIDWFIRIGTNTSTTSVQSKVQGQRQRFSEIKHSLLFDASSKWGSRCKSEIKPGDGLLSLHYERWGWGWREREKGEGGGSRRKRRRRDLSLLSFSARSRIAIQLQARMSSCNKVELKKGKENTLFFFPPYKWSSELLPIKVSQICFSLKLQPKGRVPNTLNR